MAVSRIVVSILCPGCPPESFRELYRNITDPVEARNVYERLQQEDSPREETIQDGGMIYEYVVTFSDGTQGRFLRHALA